MLTAVRSPRSLLTSFAVLLAAAGLALAPAASARADETPAPAQAPLRIAVLDTGKVLTESEEGIRIEANLRKLFDPRKAEIAQKEKQLGDEYEEMVREEKQKGRSEALERRKAEFNQKLGMLQQAAMTLQQDLSLKKKDLLLPLLQKIGTIVKGIAQKDGFDIVLEKQSAIYFRTDLELTERVIQAVNAGDGTTAKEPKAAPKKAPAAPAEPKKGDAKKPAEAPKK